MNNIDEILTLDTSKPLEENFIIDIEKLTSEERKALSTKLLQEQVVEQRNRMHYWNRISNQPAQIDSGYIGQHLVSIITGIPGGGMRGKGFDLQDESEVKTANFLDSLDQRNATRPRWNFQCNDEEGMLSFLEYPAIYVVSLDLRLPKTIDPLTFEKLLNEDVYKTWKQALKNSYTEDEESHLFNLNESIESEDLDRIRVFFSRVNYENDNIRARVWRINPKNHDILKKRYHEWMEEKGYPKLEDSERPGINFQLFPPHYFSNDDFARHGSDRKEDLPPIKIPLERTEGSKLIFEAIEKHNKINITVFDPE